MADGDAKIDGEGTHGAYAITGGTITVSGNAAAEGISSYGAAASGADSLVEIGQTAESTDEGSNGAFDIDSGKVTVVGNATANGDYSCGTSAALSGIVEVSGNTTSTGGGGYGVFVSDDGTVTIEGIITAAIYIMVESEGKYADDGVGGGIPYEDYLIYSEGSSTVRAKFHVRLTITTTTISPATMGTAYSQTVEADYTGTGMLTFSAAGLPNGLSINTSTGIINGTPAAGVNTSSPYSVTVDVTDGTLTDSRSFSLVVHAVATTTDKTLISITAPTAITGVANGTAKTTAALGLPTTVTIKTDGDDVHANVSWNVNGSPYNPSNTAKQTFTVTGTVTPPSGVINTNGVSLATSINVTVTASGETIPTIITDINTNVSYDLSSATIPSGVKSVSVGDSTMPETGSNSSVYILVKQLPSSGELIGTLDKLTVYGLKLLDQNGNFVTDFTGKIKVKIPIPDGMSGNLHVLWYDDSTGTLSNMNATVEGNFLVFETTHFSDYAIAQFSASGGTTSNPKTGDESLPYIPLALLGAGSVSGLIILKKRVKWEVKRNTAK